MSKPSRELVQEWENRLQQSGFKDIEKSSDKNAPIEHQIFSIHSVFKLRPAYVEMLSKLFDKPDMLSGRNKLILQLHLEGVSTRKIRTRISSIYPPAISQQRVCKILKELRKKAGEL